MLSSILKGHPVVYPPIRSSCLITKIQQDCNLASSACWSLLSKSRAMDLAGCFAPAKILLKNLRVDFKGFMWESRWRSQLTTWIGYVSYISSRPPWATRWYLRTKRVRNNWVPLAALLHQCWKSNPQTPSSLYFTSSIYNEVSFFKILNGNYDCFYCNEWAGRHQYWWLV